MRKKILLLLALCITFGLSATDWTVTNNDPVTVTPNTNGTGNSGSLQFCVTNALEGDVIKFAPSMSDAVIFFETLLQTPLVSLTFDASGLAKPVIFDGKSLNPILLVGGVSYSAGRKYVIKNIIFQNGMNSTADSYAGALTSANDITIENCKFLTNESTGTGNFSGGVLIRGRNANARISDCLFKGNKCPRGAALYITQSNSLIERCYFTENSGGQGTVLYMNNTGGADLPGTVVEFRNCTMVNNICDSGNDGTLIINGSASTQTKYAYLRLINLTVYGNTTTSTAKAAIWSSYRKIEVGGSLFNSNNKNDGGDGADIKVATTSVTSPETIISLGYNTYNKFSHKDGVPDLNLAKLTDFIYMNGDWLNAPLASVVNTQGVMIPIQTDPTLYFNTIKRIPLDSLKKWNNNDPVDQLKMKRVANPGCVGAYEVGGISAVHSQYTSNDKVYISDENIIVNNAAGNLISVYSIAGELLFSDRVIGDHFTKNVTTLQKGIYIARLSSGDHTINVHKIIK